MNWLKRQAALLMLISAFVQMVGLARVSVAASVFGTSSDYDAFSFVTNIAVFAFGFIGSAITVVLIPAFTQSNDRRVIDTVQTCMCIVIAVAVFLLWLLRHPLLGAISLANGSIYARGVDLVLVVGLGQALLAITGIMTAYFQCRDRFLAPKILTLISSTVLLVLIMIEPNLSIERYALLLMVANGGNALCQIIWAVLLGYRYRPNFAWGQPEFRSRMGMFGPIAVSTGAYQTTLLISTLIASSLGEGRVAALSYVSGIVAMVSAVVSSNLVTLIYPRLSVSVVTDPQEARNSIAKTCLSLAVTVTLVVVAFWSAGHSSIEALFERGSFLASDTTLVFAATSILLLSLPFDVARDTLYRFFYASGNVSDPLRNSLMASALNVTFALLLSYWFDLYGLIAGTTLATVASFFMIRYRLTAKYGRPTRRMISLSSDVTKTICAAVLSIGACSVLALLVDLPPWATAVVLASVGSVTYLGLMVVLRVSVVVGLLRRRSI